MGDINNRVHLEQTVEPFGSAPGSFRLVRRFAHEGLDWLILSNPSLDGVPFLFTARRRGARVIATYDDLRARPQQPTLEDRVRLLWLESADKLIPRLTQMNLAISSFLERRVRSIAPRTQTLLFPPIVDLNLFRTQPEKAAAFRAKWQLGDNTVISYLGTYWHVDGVGNLLKAASQLVQAGEKFKLVISGAAHQGLDCDDVPRLVNKLKLHAVVIQTGWLPTDEVVAGMCAADILVVPKLNDISNVAGVPTKLAEYMAVGRAVVTSRVGDIPLYLTDHEDALLCAPSSPEALAEGLQQLIRDVPLRLKLAANAHLTASKYFDFRTVAARIESAMVQPSGK